MLVVEVSIVCKQLYYVHCLDSVYAGPALGLGGIYKMLGAPPIKGRPNEVSFFFFFFLTNTTSVLYIEVVLVL